MIRISFTDAEVKQLRDELYTHSHPRVRTKLFCLLLKSQGLSHQEIGKIAGICQDTLREYFEQYIADGIEGLKILKFNKPRSDLEEYRAVIEEDLSQNPPATLQEAAERIEKLTGIKRSTGRISVFLKKQGLNA
jgi:transposase